MHQIKYILSACLILMMIFMGIFLYLTFPESGMIAKDGAPVDNFSNATANVVSAGEKIFRQNCAACHLMDRDMTGPALRGVGERGPWAKDPGNLKKWIKNPTPFIQTDPYAKALKQKFGILMPQQGHLSDAEIDEVIHYITSPSKNGY